MNKKRIEYFVFGFLGIVLLCLSGIFSFVGIPSNTSNENVFVSSQTTTVTVDKNGDASVYQYVYFSDKNSSLKEVYIDLDYSKDSFKTDGLAKPTLDSDNLTFSLYSSTNSFSFNSGTNEHQTAGYKYAASYDTDNSTLGGSKVEAGENKARLYFGRTMKLGTYFSVTLNYKIKSFATIFNDYTYLDMNFKPSSYPVKTYQFTLSLPFTPVDSTNFQYGLNYKTKGTVSMSNSLFQVKGDDGYYNSGIKLSAAFSSEAMNTKEDLDTNGATYIDKSVTNYIGFHILLVQADWILIAGLLALVLILVLGFLLVRSSLKKEKKEVDIIKSISTDNNSINPLSFNLASFDYDNFEDGLILYFLYNQRLTSVYYKGDLIYVKPIENSCSLLGSAYLNLFNGEEVELSELRIRVVRAKKSLLKAYKSDSDESCASILTNLSGIFFILGLVISIALMSLYFMSQRSLFVGSLCLVGTFLYALFIKGRIFLNKKEKKSYIDKKIILSNLKNLSELADKTPVDIKQMEKYLCYFRFFDYSYYLDYIKDHNRDNNYLKDSSVNKKIKIIYSLIGIA